MRSALLLLGVFGFAILADGQTTTTVRQGPQVLTLQIKAANSAETGNVLKFSGNVQLALGNSMVLVADEIDLPLSNTTLQLSGNVHLVFDAPVRIARQF
jgi:lipopolysaccharide assembly outer membrane protein LptD (OstA)